MRRRREAACYSDSVLHALMRQADGGKLCDVTLSLKPLSIARFDIFSTRTATQFANNERPDAEVRLDLADVF